MLNSMLKFNRGVVDYYYSQEVKRDFLLSDENNLEQCLTSIVDDFLQEPFDRFVNEYEEITGTAEIPKFPVD